MTEEDERFPTPADAKSKPWFGYIGVGIAIVSLLIGLGLMAIFVTWFIRGKPF